jgi:hypothetical protein
LPGRKEAGRIPCAEAAAPGGKIPARGLAAPSHAPITLMTGSVRSNRQKDRAHWPPRHRARAGRQPHWTWPALLASGVWPIRPFKCALTCHKSVLAGRGGVRTRVSQVSETASDLAFCVRADDGNRTRTVSLGIWAIRRCMSGWQLGRSTSLCVLLALAVSIRIRHPLPGLFAPWVTWHQGGSLLGRTAHLVPQRIADYGSVAPEPRVVAEAIEEGIHRVQQDAQVR